MFCVEKSFEINGKKIILFGSDVHNVPFRLTC